LEIEKNVKRSEGNLLLQKQCIKNP